MSWRAELQPNLISMSRRTFTKEEKIEIAESWIAARDRGVRQEDFAADLGVSSRRIREYVQRYRPALTLELVQDAIVKLTGTLNYVVAKIEESKSGAHEIQQASSPQPGRAAGYKGEAAIPVGPVQTTNTINSEPAAPTAPSFQWDID